MFVKPHQPRMGRKFPFSPHYLTDLFTWNNLNKILLWFNLSLSLTNEVVCYCPHGANFPPVPNQQGSSSRLVTPWSMTLVWSETACDHHSGFSPLRAGTQDSCGRSVSLQAAASEIMEASWDERLDYPSMLFAISLTFSKTVALKAVGSRLDAKILFFP